MRHTTDFIEIARLNVMTFFMRAYFVPPLLILGALLTRHARHSRTQAAQSETK